MGRRAVLLLLALGVALACARPGSAPGEAPSTARVDRGPIRWTVTATGGLEHARSRRLTFGVAGRVEEVAVEEGDRVEAGQVLARLDPGPLDLAVAQAERDLAGAQVQLQEYLEAFSEAEGAVLEARVEQARAELAQAEEALREALESARSRWEQARQALESARQNLRSLRLRWERVLEESRTALEEAQDRYRGLFRELLGLELTPQDLEAAPEEVLDRYGIDLTALFPPGKPTPPRVGGEAFSVRDDPETPWDERAVAGWTLLSPAAVWADCDAVPGLRPLGTRCVLQELREAWDALDAARRRHRENEAQARQALAQAEQVLLLRRQEEAEARRTLADLEAGSEGGTLLSLRARVAAARADLARAEEALAGHRRGPDPLVLRARRLAVESARRRLERALEDRRRAELRAPFAGVVARVEVEEGQAVGASTPVLTLVDPSSLVAKVQVDELSVARLREGLAARVLLDAFPGRALAGRIARLAPLGAVQQGVVTYEAVVVLEEVPQGVEPRAGMTVQVEFTVTQAEDALRVPRSAVRVREGRPVVEVVGPGGEVEVREVRLGVRGDRYVEVVEGLAEGEEVVLQTPGRAPSALRPLRR